MAGKRAAKSSSTPKASSTATTPVSLGLKENEQNPDAVNAVAIDRPNAKLPQVDEDLELKKARGQTESQKKERAYFEGRFQTHEPTADKKRDKGDAVGKHE